MTCYVFDARTATNHFPGIGRYALNLARALAPLLAEDETLILLRDPERPSPWNLAALPGENIQVMNVSLTPFSLRQQWVVPGLLRQLRADLYHSPYYVMPFWPGLPTVLTVYDLIPLLYPSYVSSRARLLFRWSMALALRATQHVIAISEATRHDLLTRYSLVSKSVSVVPLAADPTFAPVSPGAIAELRRRLDLPERYALYVGSNKPHKNLVLLVEAWAALQPTSLPLVIAGVWDTRYPEAQRQTEKLALGKDVRFLGRVTEADLPALYTGATLFIFPSEYEGFGLPVLEAMACGTPVACSNTSCLPEVAGDAALMFDPTSVEAIAESIGCALQDSDLRDELRERGLARAAQFSWQQTAKQTLYLYRQLVRR